MMHYVKGDATKPVGAGPKMIVHICNTGGGWGRGFVLAVSKRWPEPERFYREWAEARVLRGMQLQNLTPNGKSLVTTGDFELGQVQLVQVEPELYVLNMLAQVAPTWEAPPIRYDALDTCLMRAESMAHVLGGASVHMPRIGTGLSRGKWEQIEPLILKNFAEREVYVYDLD